MLITAAFRVSGAAPSAPAGASPRRGTRLGAAACLIVLAAVFGPPASRPALADGSQTGIIAGEVLDSGRVGLQGVQVTVSGPRIRRSGLSDEQGRFRFPALGLGTYQVTAELLGLRATATDVQVFIGKTTEVQLRLVAGQSGAAEPPPGPVREGGQEHDWIQVLAEAPVIDRFDSRVGGNVSFDFVDKLPVQLFYQSAAEVLPGTTSGTGDGNPTSSGSLRSGNLFLIDGVDTTDAVTGLFGLNLAYEAIEEVSVTTAAAPVDFGASGAVINVVTHSGTNDYLGTARLLASDKSWNSRYDYPPSQVSRLAPELAAFNQGPSRIDPIGTVSLGGPLWRDHLWFFAAYENGQNSFFGPTQEGALWDRGGDVESTAIKGTWQVTPANTLVLQQTLDNAHFNAFDPFDRGFTETRVSPMPNPLLGSGSIVDPIPGDIFALEKRTQTGNFTKAQWNTAFGQNLALEATLARQDRKISRDPLNSRGLAAGAPHVAVSDFTPPGQAEVVDAVLYNGIADRGFEDRPRKQGDLAMSWFFAAGPTDHEVKAGVDYQRTTSQRIFNFPGASGFDPLTGNPVQGQLFFDFDQDPGCLTVRCPAFNPKTGAFSPFELFNFYTRTPRITREQTVAFYLSDAVAVGRFLVSGGLRFDAVRGNEPLGVTLIDDRKLAPRLALTYDAEGSGSVLFTATFGRYYEPFLQLFLDSFNEADILSGYTQYTWNSADPSCLPANAADLSSHCWLPDGPVDFFPAQLGVPNPKLRRSYVDELTVGFKRQLTPSTGVSLHYIQRTWHDLWDLVLQQPAAPVAQLENLPFARRDHRAIELLVQKRYGDHWQLLGSYTHSRTEGNLFQNDGSSSFANFSAVTDVNLVNRFGPAPYDRTHQLKVFGSYQIPFHGANLWLGSSLVSESGVPFEQQQPVFIQEQGQSILLGVRYLTPRGSERTPWVTRLDLAAGSELRLGSRLALEVELEVFNVPNMRQVLGVEPLVTSGAFGKPRSILDLQAPRSYRLSLGFRF